MHKLPRERQDVVAILYSGFFRALPARSKRALITAFGSFALQRMRNVPERVRATAQLDESAWEKVMAGFFRMQKCWDDVQYLLDNGLSMRQSLHVASSMGSGAKSKLQAKPYLVVRLRLLTFQEIDAFARQIGADPVSEDRIVYGAEHLLQELADQGHSCLPLENLENRMARSLGISRGLVLRHLDSAANDGRIKTAVVDGQVLIGLSPLIEAEELASSKLAQLLKQPAEPISPRYVPSKFLSAEQNEAVRRALVEPVSIITGGPGTGKTHTLKGVITAYRQSGKERILLASPTGKASDRMRAATQLAASTLHRLLDYKPGEGFRRNSANPLDADLVVVDEASMVDSVLLSALLDAIKPGTKLLFVGDEDQLPSVGPGAILRDMLQTGVIPATRLTVDRRFDGGSDIGSAARCINAGQVPNFDSMHECAFIDTQSDEQTVAYVLRLAAEEITKRHGIPPSQIQVLSPRRQTIAGVEPLNEKLKPLLNPSPDGAKVVTGEQTFHTGDRVMQTSNDYELGINNGQVGTVREVLQAGRSARVEFESGVVELPKKAFRKLTLAYATTIHKSQGSEYDAVIIPVSEDHLNMLSPRLLYTAVTRAKKVVYFVGQRSVLAAGLERDSSRLDRNTMLGKALLSAAGTVPNPVAARRPVPAPVGRSPVEIPMPNGASAAAQKSDAHPLRQTRVPSPHPGKTASDDSGAILCPIPLSNVSASTTQDRRGISERSPRRASPHLTPQDDCPLPASNVGEKQGAMNGDKEANKPVSALCHPQKKEAPREAPPINPDCPF